VSFWLGAVGTLAAWLGGALLVLSEGRRAIATGIVAIALGLAATAVTHDLGAAGLLAAGGLVAAGLRFSDGSTPAGWSILPPGSSPRIILTVVAGIAALWVGVAYLTGFADRRLLVAALVVIILAGARLLESQSRPVLLGAASALALALGAAALLIPGAPAASAALAAAAASGIGLLRGAEADRRGA
jgi:hypothetical protein